MKHQITGYLLLCVGLLLILFAFISTYKVFIDHQAVIAVVQLADMNITSQFGVMTVPMANLNTLANLGLFVIFMLFVVTIGGKLATLGCNFLKIERLYEALLKGNATLTEEQVKKL